MKKKRKKITRYESRRKIFLRDYKIATQSMKIERPVLPGSYVRISVNAGINTWYIDLILRKFFKHKTKMNPYDFVFKLDGDVSNWRYKWDVIPK